MSPLPGVVVPRASDYPARQSCPSCKGSDLRIHDGPRHKSTFKFVRATFCRTCWWSVDETFIDDDALAEVERAVASARASRNSHETRRRT